MHDAPGPADAPLGLVALAHRASDRFRAAFGRPPRWLVASPGRVNLIGEHTDYSQGYVLPLAIDRYIVLAADRPAGSGGQPAIRLHSSAARDPWGTIPADGSDAASAPSWTSYVRGVVAGMRQFGFEAGPLEVEVDSSLPEGGGLSSSAALEVATATLIEAINGHVLDRVQKAQLCQKAEQEAKHVPCGIMDQFSTIFGRAGCGLLLDCRTLKEELVRLDDPAVSVLVVNSGVKHELADSPYEKRVAQCKAAAAALGVPALRDAKLEDLEHARSALEPVLYRRARHVIGENARTVRAAAAIRAGNWPEVGRLMNASHASLRDDYEVSCPELDWLVEHAGTTAGVFGARMTGGGFGGCTVSLVRSDVVEGVARAIATAYHAQWNIEPAAFTVCPVDGAGVVPL